jgi:hypothetical protein
MSTHQNPSQGEKRVAAQTVEELEMQTMELARQHAEDEVAAFEREGEVAQAAMVRVLEDASAWPPTSSWARCTPPRPGRWSRR